jgi:hypothetical protein
MIELVEMTKSRRGDQDENVNVDVYDFACPWHDARWQKTTSFKRRSRRPKLIPSVPSVGAIGVVGRLAAAHRPPTDRCPVWNPLNTDY